MIDAIQQRRNELRVLVMEKHRIGADRSVRPVMILVRERTGRVLNPERTKDRGPYVEQWIVTYNTGETRTYERLEP